MPRPKAKNTKNTKKKYTGRSKKDDSRAKNSDGSKAKRAQLALEANIALVDKQAAAAQAEGKEATASSFFGPKPKPPVTLTGKQTLSPRKHQDQRIIIATPMSLGDNSVASQARKQEENMMTHQL